MGSMIGWTWMFCRSSDSPKSACDISHPILEVGDSAFISLTVLDMGDIGDRGPSLQEGE